MGWGGEGRHVGHSATHMREPIGEIAREGLGPVCGITFLMRAWRGQILRRGAEQCVERK